MPLDQPPALRPGPLLARSDPPERIRTIEQLRIPEIVQLFSQSTKRTKLDPAQLLRGAAFPASRLWEGRSTLPLLDRFQMLLYQGKNGFIYGRTVSPASPFVGPGYFRVVADPSGDGEIAIRYAELPAPDNTPPGWPAVESNDNAAASAPFGQMEIHLRQVGPDTFAGTGLKRGKELRSYVVLTLGQ